MASEQSLEIVVEKNRNVNLYLVAAVTFWPSQQVSSHYCYLCQAAIKRVIHLVWLYF